MREKVENQINTIILKYDHSIKELEKKIALNPDSNINLDEEGKEKGGRSLKSSKLLY